MKVLAIGEILWDVFPEHELLGGAALNFCANLNRLGDDAMLITAVGNDRRGKLAIEQVEALGLSTDFIQVIDDASTGAATVRTDLDGEPHFTILRPAAFDRIKITPDTLERARDFQPDWLYFGTLMQIRPEIESITRTLAGLPPPIRCFYDLNLRPGQWNLPLVKRLCRLTSVLKLNKDEAVTLARTEGVAEEPFSLQAFCRDWSHNSDLHAICITLGAAGCSVYHDDRLEDFPGYPAKVSDTVGAGDAFAAAFLHGYHRDWPIEKTARFANALGALVAGRPGANSDWTVEELETMTDVIRTS